MRKTDGRNPEVMMMAVALIGRVVMVVTVIYIGSG